MAAANFRRLRSSTSDRRLAAPPGAARVATPRADGRKDASGRSRQLEEFLHDAQDQLGAVVHAQFVVKPLEMGVDGVRRNAQGRGNGKIRVVAEHPAHELQFTD